MAIFPGPSSSSSPAQAQLPRAPSGLSSVAPSAGPPRRVVGRPDWSKRRKFEYEPECLPWSAPAVDRPGRPPEAGLPQLQPKAKTEQKLFAPLRVEVQKTKPVQELLKKRPPPPGSKPPLRPSVDLTGEGPRAFARASSPPRPDGPSRAPKKRPFEERPIERLVEVLELSPEPVAREDVPMAPVGPRPKWCENEWTLQATVGGVTDRLLSTEFDATVGVGWRMMPDSTSTTPSSLHRRIERRVLIEFGSDRPLDDGPIEAHALHLTPLETCVVRPEEHPLAEGIELIVSVQIGPSLMIGSFPVVDRKGEMRVGSKEVIATLSESRVAVASAQRIHFTWEAKAVPRKIQQTTHSSSLSQDDPTGSASQRVERLANRFRSLRTSHSQIDLPVPPPNYIPSKVSAPDIGPQRQVYTLTLREAIAPGTPLPDPSTDYRTRFARLDEKLRGLRIADERMESVLRMYARWRNVRQFTPDLVVQDLKNCWVFYAPTIIEHALEGALRKYLTSWFVAKKMISQEQAEDMLQAVQAHAPPKKPKGRLNGMTGFS